MNEKTDLPQGTLDLLILKVFATGPAHVYKGRAPLETGAASGKRLAAAAGLILRMSQGGAK